MNNNFARRIFGLAIVLVVLATMAMAQTTKPRPAVVTNSQASYRYAHQHGYRGGYEDGFIKGKSDVNESLSRDIENSEAYNSADKGYKESMGTLAEYQEGYRIGFEVGYNDGYFGRPYSVTLPTNLSKVVIATINANNAAAPSRSRTADDRVIADTRAPEPDRSRDRVASNPASGNSSRRNPIIVRDGIQMKIRLNDQISTKTNREGDKFTAVVLDPSDYADAVIEGHIAKLNKSGKASGKTELALVFDAIHLRDNRSGRFAAQVEKIYQSEKVKSVDDEGNVESGSRTKDTAVRTGGGAVLGAIIGGVAGGGKGAAIGAAIGAGVGAGSVFIEGGKELTLEPGTELLIRSAAPANSKE
jgi:outer membrane lipoprotein SlyB